MATQCDTPVQWVCDLAKKRIEDGHDVAFFSARNESQRSLTEAQIDEWIGKGHQGLFLRPEGDYRPDEVFKSELAKFEEFGGKRISYGHYLLT